MFKYYIALFIAALHDHDILTLCTSHSDMAMTAVDNGTNANQSANSTSEIDYQEYLSRFGYFNLDLLPKQVDQTTDATEWKQKKLEEAIMEFQRFANLPVTGALDATTITKMRAPRCGVKDTDSLKRSAQFKWTKKEVSWKLRRPSNQLSVGMQRAAIFQALQIWSRVIPLDFIETVPEAEADIVIDFGMWNHGDGYSFDGRGGILGHAFYPQDGRCHFDNAENWYFQDPEKTKDGRFTEFLTVATHELGHSLGLPHSPQLGAVMAPFYSKTVLENGEVEVHLHPDDIYRIQRIYGSRPTSEGTPKKPATRTVITEGVPTSTLSSDATTAPTTAPFPTLPETLPPRRKRPDAGIPRNGCFAKIDAIFTVIDGTSYLISGATARKATSGRVGAEVPLSGLFPEGPETITMAMTKDQRLVMLFQERRVWAYEYDVNTKGFTKVDGFPKSLQADVPFSPAVGFQWNDGNLVLAKGTRFVTWDELWNKVTFEGEITNYFPGIPKTADEAFHFKNELYFLIRDSVVKYDFGGRNVTPAQPLSSLFSC